MRKGRRHSEETKKRIGDIQRGKKRGPLSLETRMKIALRLKGNKNNLGYVPGASTRELHRKRMLGTHPSEATKEKFRKIMTGKKGPLSRNWIDGRTGPNEIARGSKQNFEWRSACMIRDRYTCQKTKIKGGYLVVHHILNFSSHPDLRFDVNNGITLSRESHNLFHSIYGKKNNTREQLEEFLN